MLGFWMGGISVPGTTIQPPTKPGKPHVKTGSSGTGFLLIQKAGISDDDDLLDLFHAIIHALD